MEALILEKNVLLHVMRKSPTPRETIRLTAILIYKKRPKSVLGFEPGLPRQIAITLPLVPPRHCFSRTIQERTRRRVIITFHRANELTTTFELTTARHLFNGATPRTSIIPSILKTSPKSKNGSGKEKKKPMLSPGNDALIVDTYKN